MSLPALHRLSFEPCRPCGQPYKTWSTALKDRRVKSHPNSGGRLNAGSECGICQQKLLKNAELGDETKDVEVLIEKTGCGHAFHRTCLQMTIKSGGRNCPLCRVPIATAVLRRLSGDESVEEGERQRLGVYDADRDNNSWYNTQNERARANRPENDDGLGDPEPLPEELTDEEVREWVEYRIDFDDDEDPRFLMTVIHKLDDDFRTLLHHVGDADFERWADYVIGTVSQNHESCGERFVEILKLIPRIDARNWFQHLTRVANIALAESSASFPRCMNKIIAYLREIGEDAYADAAEADVEQNRRQRSGFV